MSYAAHESQVHLSTAHRKDLDTIMPLAEQFYRHFGYPYKEARKRAVLTELMRRRSLARMFLIQRAGATVGYVLLMFTFSLEFDGPVAFMDELFVKQGSRQQGTGSKVLAEVERLCASMGMRAIRLESEAGNSKATALYARSGYHAHDRHIMTKVIGRPEA
jgi:GNAT superfamily N-acetyltransferase